MTKLGDITYRVSTWNPTRAPGADKFDYIDLSAVDNASKSIVAPSRIAPFDAPSRARQVVSAGDVLVSTVRPNLNAVATVPPALDGATASTGFTVLRPTTRLDGQYLFHWVRSQKFVADMVSKATGASYPAVSDRIVKDSSIPLPPIDEQRRIAGMLDQADALRVKRRQTLAHLDDLTQSIFLDMFGVLESCPSAPLAAVVGDGTVVTYGIVQAGPEIASGVPYIRTGDIVDGRITPDHLRRTDPQIAAKFSRSRVESGDIVISIRATVGTTAVVPNELAGANLTQGTARIAPGDEVDGAFLLEYLRSPPAQQWIQAQVKGATFREITLARLRQLQVPLPLLERQREFAARIELGGDIRARLAAAQNVESELFASLQSRAFSGQL